MQFIRPPVERLEVSAGGEYFKLRFKYLDGTFRRDALPDLLAQAGGDVL